MIKYGFELEGFILRDGKPCLVPVGIPMDECGWLVEIRGEPHYRPDLAMALLLAEKKAVESKIAGFEILWEPLLEVPRDIKVAAARRSGKGILKYKNVYGYETHRNSTRLATASLHVSVTNERTHCYTDKDNRERTFTYQGTVDHAKLIVGMDKAFAGEIKAAKRNPGFYELKDDGRIEYRSLPNNVDMDKVVSVLRGLELTS
jgi:hypothetical protein